MGYLKNNEFFKGRGAQVNTSNKFAQHSYVADHIEGIDEIWYENSATQYIETQPKKIVSISDSPDLGFFQSINPYQGCEHGCIYCYARNSHEYWGYSAGLDFERKILIKKDAANLLEDFLNKKNYKPDVIMLSGNTDCYQPIERKLKITRGILEVLLKYRHPVSIITKNNLILRDADLLQDLAALNLLHVNITITSLREEIRQKLEPRTVTAGGRLRVIKTLTEKGVPVRLMMAPIIPGLTSDEVPSLVKAAADAGAADAAFTMLRLNGAIAELFRDWLDKTYPDKASRILNMVASCHGGKVNDSDWGRRIRGDGKIAESIHSLFALSKSRFMSGRSMPPYDHSLFRPARGLQLKLF